MSAATDTEWAVVGAKKKTLKERRKQDETHFEELTLHYLKSLFGFPGRVVRPGNRENCWASQSSDILMDLHHRMLTWNPTRLCKVEGQKELVSVPRQTVWISVTDSLRRKGHQLNEVLFGYGYKLTEVVLTREFQIALEDKLEKNFKPTKRRLRADRWIDYEVIYYRANHYTGQKADLVVQLTFQPLVEQPAEPEPEPKPKPTLEEIEETLKGLKEIEENLNGVNEEIDDLLKGFKVFELALAPGTNWADQ